MPCSWSCRVILKVFGCCFQSVASAAQWSSFSRCQSGPFFLLCRAANYPRVAELFSYFLVTKERERLLLLLSLPGIFWKKQYCLLVFWKKEFWTLEKPLNSKHLMVGGFCRKKYQTSKYERSEMLSWACSLWVFISYKVSGSCRSLCLADFPEALCKTLQHLTWCSLC